MKKVVVISFLVLLGVVPIYSQTNNGAVPFNCPDVPLTTFEFTLNPELISSMSSAEVFNSVQDLYVHVYEQNFQLFENLNEYYTNLLLKNGWDNYAEDDNYSVFHLVNAAENSISKDESVAGIFAIIKSHRAIYLLNIVGTIPHRQIGTLLANLNLLGIWLPELRSLGEQIDKQREPTDSIVTDSDEVLYNNSTTRLRIIDDSMKSQLMFSGTMQETHFVNWTYNSKPINRIKINSFSRSSHNTHSQRIDAVKRVLFGETRRIGHSEDFAVLWDRLLHSDAAKYVQKVAIDTDEELIRISLEGIPDNQKAIQLPQIILTQAAEPIHEIQIQGNLDLDLDRLKTVFEDEAADINKAMVSLPNVLPELGSVEIEIMELSLQRIAKIKVSSEPVDPKPYVGLFPHIGFNRVTGWELGFRTEIGMSMQQPHIKRGFNLGWNSNVPRPNENTNIFGQFSYGFSNEQPYYAIGGNQVWGKRQKWKLGLSAQYHRTLSTISPELYAGYEEQGLFFLRLIGVPDHQDYFLRKGTELTFYWKPTWSTKLSTSLLSEKHDDLQKTTDWHLFNWRSNSEHRENIQVTPANIRSVNFKAEVNDRSNYFGWHNTFLVEYTHPSLGSDYDWTRIQTHLRYSIPFGRHQVRNRLVLSSAIGEMTEYQNSNTLLPVQRQLSIGGLGTLNGYPMNTFIGDKGYLFNVEFLIGLPIINQIEFLKYLYTVLFFDIGQVWNENGPNWNFEPKASAGVGIQISNDIDILRFNISKAIDSQQEVRYNLMFFYSY